MANLTKTNTEMSFKKIHTLSLSYVSKNMLSEDCVKFCFFVTFNIIISYIFSGNFFDFLKNFPLFATKTNVSIYKINLPS